MPEHPRRISSLRYGAYDDPPATASIDPRLRRSRLQRAIMTTSELAREVVGMVDTERAGRVTPTSRRRQRSPSTEQDESRQRQSKRRMLEEGSPRAPRPSIKYGHFGQVEPGKLELELVSCDGGEHTDVRHPNTYLGPKNLLRHDKSVYCSERPTTNIILRHADDTPFCLEKLHIVGPQHGFTAPVREGLAYIAMTMTDLQKYIDPPPHARLSASNPHDLSASRRFNRRTDRQFSERVRRTRDSLGLLDALHDPEINAAMENRNNADSDEAPDLIQNESHPYDYRDEPDAHCEYSPSDDGDHQFYDTNLPITLLSDEETGPEESTSPEVLNFIFHRERMMRRRREFENDEWDNVEHNADGTLRVSVDDDQGSGTGPSSLNRLDSLMARSRVYDSPRSPPPANVRDRAGEAAHKSAELEAMNDPNITLAHFQIKRNKQKVAVKFNPAVSGRFVLLKMWAGRNNVDIQSVIAKGYGGLRFFPARELV